MTHTQPRRVPAIARKMMQFQAFLLRHGLLGNLGDELMVITTFGRKSGKRFSTPIGFLKDAQAILALNPHGRSDWFKNLIVNPRAELEIRGKTIMVHAERVIDPQERSRIFELYRRQRARSFKLLFGVAADAPENELQAALETREFIRFLPTA